MAAYTQFGYGGYPSATQLLSSNPTQSPQTADTATAGPNAMTSPNAPAHSPATTMDCRTNTASLANATTVSSVPGSQTNNTNNNNGGGDASSGALSPDGLSQNSNNLTNTNSTAGNASLENLATGVGSSVAAGLAGITGNGSSSTCCENGRPIMTDPVSGQTVCSCQYDSARLALSSYSRLPASSVGVYGTPYPSTEQNPYQSIGVDSSAFYSPLSNPYALKDSTSGSEMTAWTSAGLQPTTGYYSYDPMGAYGYSASYDLASRRKNATRESTATLKAWLNEHKKNPYPTKGEKIMLAIITKMTLTQVSTWFANARRRLKKENKMTWEPKNRADDDDDGINSDDDKDDKDMDSEKSHSMHGSSGAGGAGGMTHGMGLTGRKDNDKDDDDDHLKSAQHPGDMRMSLNYPGSGYPGGNHPHSYHPYHHQHPAYYQQSMFSSAYHHPSSGLDSLMGAGALRSHQQQHQQQQQQQQLENTDSKNLQSRDCGVPIPASKPKIWSLADTVASKTPPPNSAAYMAAQQQLRQQPAHQQQHHNPMQQLQQMSSLLTAGNSSSSSSSHNNSALTTNNSISSSNQAMIAGTTAAAAAVSAAYNSNNPINPYTRMPSTAYGNFLGAIPTTSNTHSYNSNSTSNSNTHSNSSSSSNNVNSSQHHIPTTISTPTIAAVNTNMPANHHHSSSSNNPQRQPTAAAILSHQQQLQQQHQQQTSHQRGMGFPEAQPDTPPQTPPNMKLPSVQLATNLLLTATQAHMTATCHNISSNNNITSGHSSHPYNYSRPSYDYSPRDENSSGSSCSSGSQASSAEQDKIYKAIFKSQQLALNGFVPPV